MYPEALAYLRCPACPDSGLELAPGAVAASDTAVLHGQVRCSTCASMYTITNGIVDLLGPYTWPGNPAQFVNYFPPTAWAYERLWRPRSLTLLTGEPFGYERELPLVTGLVAPQRGGLYLDVGCSNGLYARALDHALPPGQGHIVGVDHSLPMLRQARAFALRQQRRVTFVRARAQRLPFAAGSASGVVIGGSLNEMSDVPGCLREVYRTLAPTGRCMLMSLAQAGSLPGRTVQTLVRPGGITFWRLDMFNRLLAATGLRLMAQWRYGVVLFSLAVPRVQAAPVVSFC